MSGGTKPAPVRTRPVTIPGARSLSILTHACGCVQTSVDGSAYRTDECDRHAWGLSA